MWENIRDRSDNYTAAQIKSMKSALRGVFMQAWRKSMDFSASFQKGLYAKGDDNQGANPQWTSCLRYLKDGEFGGQDKVYLIPMCRQVYGYGDQIDENEMSALDELDRIVSQRWSDKVYTWQETDSQGSTDNMTVEPANINVRTIGSDSPAAEYWGGEDGAWDRNERGGGKTRHEWKLYVSRPISYSQNGWEHP